MTVFIDTNPAMTIYTKLALCAADNLVMVAQADDFSKEALKYVSTIRPGRGGHHCLLLCSLY